MLRVMRRKQKWKKFWKSSCQVFKYSRLVQNSFWKFCLLVNKKLLFVWNIFLLQWRLLLVFRDNLPECFDTTCPGIVFFILEIFGGIFFQEHRFSCSIFEEWTPNENVVDVFLKKCFRKKLYLIKSSRWFTDFLKFLFLHLLLVWFNVVQIFYL